MTQGQAEAVNLHAWPCVVCAAENPYWDGSSRVSAPMQGYALLLSAVPNGPGRVLDTSVGGARLAAVPPAALTGTQVASAVHLADPVEPNTVLTHLRTAAAAPGPLVVYVLGQVMADRRQHAPHVALARTTAHTIRYTGLPWSWLAHELRGLGPDRLTVFADLVAADPAAWHAVTAEPDAFVGDLPLYGVLAPPPARRTHAVPHYTYALCDLLRSGDPAGPPDRLHQLALARAGLGAGGELLLHGGPAAGRVAAPPARLPTTAPTAPTAVRRPEPERVPPTPAPIAPEPEPGAAAGPAGPTPRAESTAAGREATGPEPAAVPEPPPPAPEAAAAGPAPEDAGPEDDEPGPAGPEDVLPDTTTEPETSEPEGEPGAPEVPAVPPMPAHPPAPAGGVPRSDPHAAIRDAARAGRFGEANEIVNICEQTAMRARGQMSDDAVHWREVRADLAMLADDRPAACALWMGVAEAYLAGGREAEEKPVVDAVDRAHFCWGRIDDRATALRLADRLVALRTAVPGRQPGAAEKLRLRLAALSA